MQYKPRSDLLPASKSKRIKEERTKFIRLGEAAIPVDSSITRII
jgi:hypothetical protein